MITMTPEYKCPTGYKKSPFLIMMTGRLYIWLFSHVSLKGENRNRSTRRQVTQRSGEESQERIRHICGVMKLELATVSILSSRT